MRYFYHSDLSFDASGMIWSNSILVDFKNALPNLEKCKIHLCLSDTRTNSVKGYDGNLFDPINGLESLKVRIDIYLSDMVQESDFGTVYLRNHY